MPTCNEKPELRELQKIAADPGHYRIQFPKTTRKYENDTSNPFFNIDRNKCILCAKCVRACNEITCVDAIEIINRGLQLRWRLSVIKTGSNLFVSPAANAWSAVPLELFLLKVPCRPWSTLFRHARIVAWAAA